MKEEQRGKLVKLLFASGTVMVAALEKKKKTRCKVLKDVWLIEVENECTKESSEAVYEAKLQ